MKSDTQVVLEQARAFIAQGFTKCAEARDREGGLVPFNSKEACSFCIIGAVYRAGLAPDALAEQRLIRPVIAALVGVIPVVNHKSLSLYNDAPDTTQQDVLDLFDRALKGVQAVDG